MKYNIWRSYIFLLQYFNFICVIDIHPLTAINRGSVVDSYTDGFLFPLLKTISEFIFSFAYILLMISPLYGENAPKILTTLISGVRIFYRLIVMTDFATPTFLNAVNLLTSLDNLGFNLIFGLPTKLNHAHIRHLTNNPPDGTRVLCVGLPGAHGGTCSAVAVTLRVQMNSAR